jgi:8-oxo-dGTP diphosphatase
VLRTVDVAVGIVRDRDGRVLLAQRTARQIAPAFWELPGGKIDPGETPRDAAARELFEETGVEARVLRPWIVYEHAFSTKRVRLHFFNATKWAGEPHGREGQRIAWADPWTPHVAPILASNERALFGLGLPAMYVQTHASKSGGAQAFAAAVLPRLLEAGVRLIEVCEPDMLADQRVVFARRVAEAARSFGARVLLDGTPLEAHRAGACGVHSAAPALRRLLARPQAKMWIAGCGDAGDLALAAALGADAAVVSCASVAELRELAEATPFPLYVRDVCGLTPQEARAAGAAGVAMSSLAVLGGRGLHALPRRAEDAQSPDDLQQIHHRRSAPQDIARAGPRRAADRSTNRL